MIVNWANKYDDVIFAKAHSDTRVFNMFVRAWNERLSVLSQYQSGFETCQQFSVPPLFAAGVGTMIPMQLFPEVKDGDIVNATNTQPDTGGAHRFEATAKFDSLGSNGLTITFHELTAHRLIPGLIVKIGTYFGKVTSFVENSSGYTVGLDRPFQEVTQPNTNDTIYFRGKFFDNSINPRSWYALIVDVFDKIGYFVKNQEANGTTSDPARFFVDKPSIVGWGNEPNYFDITQKPANWTGSFKSYGPPSLFSKFERKFWREIQLQDNYTFDFNNNRIVDDRGAFVFKCKLIDNHKISGPLLIKTKNGFENITPTIGMRARLTQSAFRDNSAFKYYVFGHTFEYDGTNWVETIAKFPDLIETTGFPQIGDIFGPWILNSLKTIIDAMAWTFALGFTDLHNAISGILHLNLLDPIALAGVKNAQRGSMSIELFKIDFGTFHVGDRVNIKSTTNWITVVNGNRLTLGAPLLDTINTAEDQIRTENSIFAYKNFAHADLDESNETRWKRTLKIKNLDSIIRVGMNVYINEVLIGVLTSFTSTTITLDRFSNKPLSGKLFFTETTLPLVTTTGDIVEPDFNWMTNDQTSYFHYYYNPIVEIAHIGQFEPDCEFLYRFDRVHMANPAGVWGSYPNVSAFSAISFIYGPGPASKNFVREYDYYNALNNVHDDHVVGRLQDEVDNQHLSLIPTKVPQYTFTYQGTDRVLKAEKLREANDATLIGLAPEDKQYVAYSLRLNLARGMIVCRWDVPGGFTYTKERNVDE